MINHNHVLRYRINCTVYAHALPFFLHKGVRSINWTTLCDLLVDQIESTWNIKVTQEKLPEKRKKERKCPCRVNHLRLAVIPKSTLSLLIDVKLNRRGPLWFTTQQRRRRSTGRRVATADAKPVRPVRIRRPATAGFKTTIRPGPIPVRAARPQSIKRPSFTSNWRKRWLRRDST